MAKKDKAAAVAEPEVVEEPKKKKASKDTAAAIANITSMDQVATDEWQELLDDLGSESNDPRIYFIKAGRNRMRLVPEDNDPKKFFVKFSRTYDGTVRTKFLIRAVVMGKKNDDARIQAVPVGKVVITQILNLLTEGYELFHPTKGRGVTIVKSGQGREGTSYSTLTSPDPVPLPKGLLDLTDKLAKIAADMQEADEKRAAENKGGSGRTQAKTLGRGKTAPSAEDEGGDW